MHIVNITVSGADDSVPHHLLRELVQMCPSVEFGILLSRKRVGQTRYPSRKWLRALKRLPFDVFPRFSAHLCGNYVEEALRGELAAEIRELLPLFGRVQFNFIGLQGVKEIATSQFFNLLNQLTKEGKEIIFQQSGIGIPLLHSAYVRDIPVMPLYDASGGTGSVPSSWSRPVPGTRCGYAGGLSPDNLQYELGRIAEVAGDARVWIDAESGLRTPNDRFDAERARAFLRIEEEWSQTLAGAAS